MVLGWRSMSFDIKRRLAIDHKKNSLNSKKPFWSMSKIRERKNRRTINDRKKENESNNMRIKKKRKKVIKVRRKTAKEMEKENCLTERKKMSKRK